jgi:hypothetical protein
MQRIVHLQDSDTMEIILRFTFGLLLLVSGAQAQFQFFEQMFQGGGQQQHQAPRDVPSDPSGYQQRYDGCKSSSCSSVASHD